MKQLARIAVMLAVSAFGLAACTTTETIEWDMDDPKNSLLFAYIDMEDAPTDMSWASLKQVVPATDSPYWNFAVEDGVIFQPYVREGGYQIAAFGGSGFFSGEHQYSFPEYGNESAIMIKTPGIYYFGAFKYVEVDTGWLEQSKFSMERIESPSEIEVLRKILEHEDIRESPNWQRRINARIRELSR